MGIELKFEILDQRGLKRFVKNLKVVETRRIVDTYLDTMGADLFRRGIFVRIRNGKKFDIKFNEEDFIKGGNADTAHTHYDEVSHALPLSEDSVRSINRTLKVLGLVPMACPSIEDLARRNNLVESVTIDKRRVSYQDGGFRIDIDDVRGLGRYLEIERMADESVDHERILNAMRHHLKGLGLRHVDVGYNELYWRKHDFDLYLQGKYLLDEDRSKYGGHRR